MGNLNTPLTPLDLSMKQKLSKETTELTLTNGPEQMNLIDIYRIILPKDTENTFFSAVHNTFSRINHMIEHKTSLTDFKKQKLYHASLQTIME